MRKHGNKSSPRRASLTLEPLEDRSVPSAGGLLSLLTPTGGVSTQPSAPSSALATLVNAPPAAAPVLATANEVGGGLLSPVTQPAVAAPTANVLNVDSGLGVGLPLIQAGNVQVDVGLLPAAPGQPLASLGVGGDVAVGPATGALLSLSPEVTVSEGGTALVSADVGTQGQVAGVPLAVGVSGANPPSASATLAGITLSQTLAADGPVSGGGSAVGALLSAVESAAGVTDPAARPAPVVNADPGGAGATDPGASLTGETQSAALAAADGSVTTGADGGAGDPAPAPPPLATPGAGRVVQTTLDPEGAGLATRFQPFGPAAFRLPLAARAASPGGWLAGLLARLRQAAPWLAALVGVGAVYEIRRRRRAARRAAPVAR